MAYTKHSPNKALRMQEKECIQHKILTIAAENWDKEVDEICAIVRRRGIFPSDYTDYEVGFEVSRIITHMRNLPWYGPQ